LKLIQLFSACCFHLHSNSLSFSFDFFHCVFGDEQHLSTQMPYIKFILPTAPTQPVTMNMGLPMPSWYDIVGLDERSNEKCAGIEESRKTLVSILATEHETTKLPYSRMALAGFSQGGALSIFTGMQMEKVDQKLAGILVMSGYLAGFGQFKITPGLEDTPVLHCHGMSDPMVPFGMAEKSRDKAIEKGATDYKLEGYAGLQHSVCPQEIADAAQFLSRILPPDDSCKIQLKDPSEMSVKELKEAIRKAGLGSKAVGLMEKAEFVKLVKDHREGKC